MLKRGLPDGDEAREKAVSAAILQGAGLRVRPVLMTAVATIIGLVPIVYRGCSGSEVVSRLVAPMMGDMLSSVVLTLFIIPVVYLLWKKRYHYE